MLEPRCLSLAGAAKHVRVNSLRIGEIARDIAQDPPPAPSWTQPAFPAANGSQLDAVVWLGNAVNFCYWVPRGRKMWQTAVGGEPTTDAFAIFGTINNALSRGVDLCDASTLRGAAPTLFDDGKRTLPLVSERVAHLVEIADVVERDFGGRLENAIDAAGLSAPAHAAFLAKTFTAFEDTRDYRSAALPFRKRAQLAAGMLHAARLGRGAAGLSDTDQLTVYADYMVPRVLRSIGAISYDADLSAAVDAQKPLEASSPQEIEIRIGTIAAGALLIRGACKAGAHISAIELDYWLWQRGFEIETPHHRTLTTDY